MAKSLLPHVPAVAKVLLVSAPLLMAGVTSVQAQCTMGASCSPNERISSPGIVNMAVDATSAASQPGTIGFSQTFGTSAGGTDSFSRVTSSSDFPGAVEVTSGKASPAIDADQSGVPSVLPQLNVPSATALHSRLHPTLVTTDGPARSSADGVTGSLWNSESVLYKQDATGAACSLNKQGPLVSTCR